jgi:putative transposase
MPIRKRVDLAGPALVFITTTVRSWKPAFNNRKLAITTINQLKETLGYHQVSMVGYVLMPSHLHALLGFKRIELLSRFMQSFKILSSKKIRKLISGTLYAEFTLKDKFRFWMPRFDDLIITSDNQFRIKLNYIHNNPVEAGLADKASDYEFSSAIDWLTDASGLIPIDKSFGWY